jgi:hypothetical protein
MQCKHYSAEADCADDEAVTGGGYIVGPQNTLADFIVNANVREGQQGNGWAVQVYSAIDDVHLQAFCRTRRVGDDTILV